MPKWNPWCPSGQQHSSLQYSKNRNERGKVRNKRGNLWYQNVVFFWDILHFCLVFGDCYELCFNLIVGWLVLVFYFLLCLYIFGDASDLCFVYYIVCHALCFDRFGNRCCVLAGKRIMRHRYYHTLAYRKHTQYVQQYHCLEIRKGSLALAKWQQFSNAKINGISC